MVYAALFAPVAAFWAGLHAFYAFSRSAACAIGKNLYNGTIRAPTIRPGLRAAPSAWRGIRSRKTEVLHDRRDTTWEAEGRGARALLRKGWGVDGVQNPQPWQCDDRRDERLLEHFQWLGDDEFAADARRGSARIESSQRYCGVLMYGMQLTRTRARQNRSDPAHIEIVKRPALLRWDREAQA
jgi:hypothetical protein